MNICENSGLFVKIIEYLWKYRNICENTWISVKITEYLWKYWNIYENNGIYVKITEYLWKYKNMCENNGIFVKKPKYLWKYWNICENDYIQPQHSRWNSQPSRIRMGKNPYIQGWAHQQAIRKGSVDTNENLKQKVWKT